jgi:hypothetical protein
MIYGQVFEIVFMEVWGVDRRPRGLNLPWSPIIPG